MEHVTLRTPTDTAHPPQAIPIYLIHSIATPFCQQPECWCQTNKRTAEYVLTALNTGELRLSTAARFAEGNAV
jgi:hypothetical protein